MTDLHEFLTIANKTFGDNTAVIIDENSKVDIDVVSTGVEAIDEALGVGGIPRGRISEVYGKEATGKTTLCLQAIARAHKDGLNAAYVDAEHALSYERMKALGVDTSKLVLSQPQSGEQALEFVEMAVRSGKFAIIVVDSVAALTPEAEVQKEMGESVMGVHARLMSQAMRKLTAPVAKHNVALVFTNQTRAKIGGYVVGETTTGGNALKFYCSVRIKLQSIGKIKDGSGVQIANKIRMTVVKNKLAVPYKVIEYQIDGHGINADIGWIDALVESGKITRSGAWFKIGNETIAQGKQALVEALRSDEVLRERLKQA